MLSVVIVVWNEEKNLPRVVSSVKNLADEIVVVDTESTDDSVAVAKKLGCRVFKHKNTGIVEPVRNFAIDKARGDWILMLDADEEISGSLLAKIKESVQDPEADYFRIPRKSIIFGKWIQSDHWWPDYVYRLFKKGSVTWDEKIHSIPFTRGEGRDFPAQEQFSITHHHYSTVSQYVDRLNRYTDHQVKLKQEEGYNFSWQDLVARPMAEFINQYFARRGYRQGTHGVALAALQAFSELVLYLKLWQASDFVTAPVSPGDVTTLLSEKAKEYTWWTYEAKIRGANPIMRGVWKLRRTIGL